jgi:hypothetical protein
VAGGDDVEESRGKRPDSQTDRQTDRHTTAAEREKEVGRK